MFEFLFIESRDTDRIVINSMHIKFALMYVNAK